VTAEMRHLVLSLLAKVIFDCLFLLVVPIIDIYDLEDILLLFYIS
jgi:hypothetical protein